MSFFSRFQKAGGTTISQEKIQAKIVKVEKAPPPAHPLPIIAHTSRTGAPKAGNGAQSHNSASSATGKSKSATPSNASKSKNGLLSVPNDRGRDFKAGRENGKVDNNGIDATRERSRKRKEGSTSSITRARLTSPSTASLRSVSPGADSATSQSKKRRLTPTVNNKTENKIQPKKPVYATNTDDSDSDSDGETRISKEEQARKLREAEELGITQRIYVNPKSFKAQKMAFVHAEQIANPKLGGYTKRYSRPLEVSLACPAMPLNERYSLVKHADKDEFNPYDELRTTMEMVAHHLLTPEERLPITADHDGIIQQLRRADRKDIPELLLSSVTAYNELMRKYRKSGTFARNISSMATSGSGVPHALAEHILSQCYARSVALEVDALRDYVPFSNNVYGELKPTFTAQLFKDTKLRHDHVFVDLGSGTGNVVLHAALAVGCESWGCEMVEKTCELADAQAREFEARCVLWGIKAGQVRLEKGSFLENPHIPGVLTRTDVLLVNNFAFDSALNMRLVDMFLDLRDGTRIISLKSFRPRNYQISGRTANSPLHMLREERKRYAEGSVSWTDQSGEYFLYTVDRSIIQEYQRTKGRAES